MDGKISFFGSSDGSVRIEIEDKSSGVMFFVGKMSAEDFGRGITGLSCRPIEYKTMGLDIIGKTVEVKTVKIPYEWDLSKNFSADMEQLVEPYEVDGWKAEDIKDINRHCLKDGKYKVTFRRYIETPD